MLNHVSAYNTLLKVLLLYYVLKLLLANSTKALHFLQSHKETTVSSKYIQELHYSLLWVHTRRITDASYLYESWYTVCWDVVMDASVSWCVWGGGDIKAHLLAFCLLFHRAWALRWGVRLLKGILSLEWVSLADLWGWLQSKKLDQAWGMSFISIPCKSYTTILYVAFVHFSLHLYYTKRSPFYGLCNRLATLYRPCPQDLYSVTMALRNNSWHVGTLNSTVMCEIKKRLFATHQWNIFIVSNEMCVMF